MIIKGLARLLKDVDIVDPVVYECNNLWCLSGLNVDNTAFIVVKDYAGIIFSKASSTTAKRYVIDANVLWDAVKKIRRTERVVLEIHDDRIVATVGGGIVVGEANEKAQLLPEPNVKYIASISVDRPQDLKSFVKHMPGDIFVYGINSELKPFIGFIGFIAETMEDTVYTLNDAFGLAVKSASKPSATMVSREHFVKALPVEFVRGRHCIMRLAVPEMLGGPGLVYYECSGVEILVYIAPSIINGLKRYEKLLKRIINESPPTA